MSEGKADLRRQLRHAWAHLGCRCIFDKRDRKITEDAHCPYHGVYEQRCEVEVTK